MSDAQQPRPHRATDDDPSKNVRALTAADVKRQDDLAKLRGKLADAKIKSLTAMIKSAAVHQRELDKAESDRLNSIRQVDREEVAKSAVTANTAITTLAKQTTDLQTTLQKQTADIAVAVEQRQSAFASDTNKRLSAVELALSEGKGKQQVSDPAMERMAIVVERIERQQQVGTGTTAGLDKSWQIVLALIGLAFLYLNYQTKTAAPDPGLAAILNELKAERAPPTVIYTPAPPGTQLPTTPATVPR